MGCDRIEPSTRWIFNLQSRIKNSMTKIEFRNLKDHLADLPPKLQELGRFILSNHQQVIFMTVRQLAAAAGVSEASIMRFVGHCGYKGYSDFLAKLRGFLAAQIPPSLADGDATSPWLEACQEEVRRLMTLAVRLDGDSEMTELVRLVQISPTIYILTSPAARADGWRLRWSLGRLRSGVLLAEGDQGDQEETIWTLPTGSLVLALTTPPGTMELRALARLAAERKLPLFVVNEGRPGLLSEFSDHQTNLESGPWTPLGAGLALPLWCAGLVQAVQAGGGLQQQKHQTLLNRVRLKHQPLQERQDTLQLAIGHEIRSLDPARAHNIMREPVIMSCIYQGLVKFAEGTWELSPQLATHWQMAEDGQSVIFYLRRGVQFHRGYGEFSAEDVKFSFERFAREQDAYASLPAWQVLQEVQVLGRYVVKVVLKRPCPHLFSTVLPLSTGYILSKKALEQIGASQHALNPIGTGPYELKEFRPRDYLELEAFDDYWDQPPHTPRLIFRLDTHAFNFLYRFNTGRLDVAVFPNVNRELLKSVPGLTHRDCLPRQFWWLGMLVNQPPFDRPAARQAVHLALDLKRIREMAIPGSLFSWTPVSPDLPGHWSAAPAPEYSPVRARELMAQAGVAQGTRLILVADPTEVDLTALEIVKANLADIGLEVILDLCNRKALLEKIHRQQCHLYLFFFNSTQDAYHTLNWFIRGQVYNFSYWDHPPYDALVAQIAQETDEAKRLAMIVEAQKMIVEAGWGVWLAHGHNSIIYQDYVDIGQPRPDGFLTPWTLVKKI